MKTQYKLFPVLAASALALLSGCGNGSNTTAISPVSTSRAGKGSVKITVRWPEAPKTRQSRLIPIASQSIAVFITSGRIDSPFDFNAKKLVARPASGNSSTVTIDNIPEATDYSEVATAYPNADGTGQAQATGTIKNVIVKASQVTTTPDLTMNTTIKSLAVTPSATTGSAGGAAIMLTATAKDANGAVVLTTPGTYSWASDNPTFGTLTASGNPASLSPLAAGVIKVTATETESKVSSAAVTLTISAGTGGGGGGSTDKSKVFVADAGNNRIVGLDSIPATSFTPFSDYNPQAVAVDSLGRIYFSSYNPGTSKIFRVDDVTGTNQAVYSPAGATASLIAVDKQNRIYYYSDDMSLTRIDDIAGSNLVSYNPTNSFGSHLLNGTNGIATDSLNKIYVIQGLASRVMRFDDMTGANTVLFGTKGSGVGQFNNPSSIAIDSANRIYVADAGNHRIVRFDDLSGANWVSFAIPSEVGSTSISHDSIAVDGSASPRIYFTDLAKGIVYRMDDMSGGNLTQYGATGSGSGQFMSPDALAVK